MHVISRKALVEFWGEHPDAEAPLRGWYKVAKRAAWRELADVRADFGHADRVGRLTVFDVGGNKYRLVAEILYDRRQVLIRAVLTHREYDEGKWRAPPAPKPKPRKPGGPGPKGGR